MSLHTTDLGERGSRVVFCHGLFGQGRNWTQIGKQLAGEHRVTLVDMPHHGRSSWPEEFDYVDVADRVARLLDGDDPVTLVGHSMGGKAAMTLAAAPPPRRAAVRRGRLAGGLRRTGWFRGTSTRCSAWTCPPSRPGPRPTRRSPPRTEHDGPRLPAPEPAPRRRRLALAGQPRRPRPRPAGARRLACRAADGTRRTRAGAGWPGRRRPTSPTSTPTSCRGTSRGCDVTIKDAGHWVHRAAGDLPRGAAPLHPRAGPGRACRAGAGLVGRLGWCGSAGAARLVRLHQERRAGACETFGPVGCA